MPTEYKTIQEVAGPLMLVEQRRWRHLRRAGGDRAAERRASAAARCSKWTATNALVQLFEIAAGHQPCRQQGALPRPSASELGVSRGYARPCLQRHGRADRRRSGHHRRGAPATSTVSPMNPAARDYPARVHPDRRFHHRRTEHPGSRPEAADLLRLRSAPRQRSPRRSPVRRRCAATVQNRSRLCSPPSASPLRKPNFFIHELQEAPAPSTARSVCQPCERPCHRAYRHAAYGADRRGVSGV